MSSNWDVIVVGGGIWGLACAYACAKRGQSVAVFEAGKIGCGASGGIVGALAPHVPESWSKVKQFQYEALSSAEEYWADVDAISGMSSGYGRIGRVMPITTARDRVLCEERAQNAKDIWQGKYHWNVLETHPLLPKHITPYGVAHDTLSGRVFPAKAVASLAQACLKTGVQIIEHQQVTEITDNQVHGPWGQAHANAIILAAGVEGFSLLDKHMGCSTGTGVKGQAALLACDLGTAPQLYANVVYVIPHMGGVTAIGSTAEKTWDDPFETDEKLDAVIDKARLIFPSLKDANVIQRWAGLRPKARRRHPMLGPVPQIKGVYCAMGAYTVGFGIAHKVGEVLADFAGGAAVDLPKNFTVDWQMAI